MHPLWKKKRPMGRKGSWPTFRSWPTFPGSQTFSLDHHWSPFNSTATPLQVVTMETALSQHRKAKSEIVFLNGNEWQAEWGLPGEETGLKEGQTGIEGWRDNPEWSGLSLLFGGVRDLSIALLHGGTERKGLWPTCWRLAQRSLWLFIVLAQRRKYAHWCPLNIWLFLLSTPLLLAR